MSMLVVFGLLVGALAAGLWFAALIEVIRTPDGYPAGNQNLWVTVLLLGVPLGLLLYSLLGRPHQSARRRARAARPRRTSPSTWLR